MAGVDPLTSRLARGEPEAFAEAYDAFGPRLHAYLLGLTGDRGLAEDLLQAVMLRLVRHRDRLRGVENLKAWLYVVARNEARRHGRRASTRPMAALDTGVFEIAASADATRDPDPEPLPPRPCRPAREAGDHPCRTMRSNVASATSSRQGRGRSCGR